MKTLKFSKKTILAAISFILLATALGSSAQAESTVVILSDTFTSNPGSMSDRPVENPQTTGDAWDTSNTNPSSDVAGSGVWTLDGLGSFAKGAAPLNTATLTGPYTLSYHLSFNPGTGTSNSGFNYYGGFGNSAGNGASFSDYQGSLDFSVDTNTTGTSFTLHAGNGPFVDTLSKTITRPDTSTAYSIDLAITMNPKTDVADFSVDGSSIGTTTYTGPIGGLTFKANYANAVTGYTGFQASNLEVTELIPEPSTYALLLAGLGFLGLAARRRGQV